MILVGMLLAHMGVGCADSGTWAKSPLHWRL
jgi:hypothetical protein